jgi:hypothetical protein
MDTVHRPVSGDLRAKVGDRLVVRGLHHPDRDAEILEVRHEDGTPPYVVRWSDTGQVGLIFPGPESFVQRFPVLR